MSVGIIFVKPGEISTIDLRIGLLTRITNTQ